MMYQIVFLIINSIGGFFVVNKLFWIIGIGVNILTGLLVYKNKIEEKTIGMFLFTSILISFFGFFRGFDMNYFYALMNVSSLLITFFKLLNKKVFSLLSWTLNGIALGYFLAQARDQKTGIIIGLIIIALGVKDTYSKKAKDILNP
ncbi:hypothetical protein OSSY52_17690 [Tepiditoga spiralis]|uniref:Uncharacterized protein n=1 Tax=Tepiditoga spiralis TaxID=2108365 RepID=A0A7G1G4Z7_9BACT|nr:hypothetical protein [Tepiditoga spiralis]BBE31628.1 hypothetical protein OSSY52_17690 [Tepiditoga spiralis]